METNHRINSIDIARLFAAILVIAIHTQAIMWFSERANGNIQILTRVAVPFFFCTSGYFLQKGYVRKGCSAIATSIWKVFRLYLALSIVYFAVIFLQNPALLYRVKKWMLIDFLFNGSYYHLWYMVGVIYSTAMIYLICKLKLAKMMFPLAVLCYTVGLLGTSYYGIGSRLPIMSTLFDSGCFLCIRRIFLMGFPFTVLGWTISENATRPHLTGRKQISMTALAAVFFVAETIVVTVTGLSKTVVITIFLYPLLYLLFQICLAYPLSEKSELALACRNTANFIYFWHPIVILALNKLIGMGFLLFVATTAVCLILGFGYHSLKKHRRPTQ